MALTTTTLTAAVAVTDREIKVSSATGFVAGYLVKVNQEIMRIVQTYVVAVSGTTIPVIRGIEGSATAAHPSGSSATAGIATDFAASVPQAHVWYPTARHRTVTSYNAAGAITLPIPGNDAVAVLNGTGALAMTLANPTADMDGDVLTVIGNGKAAHTITYTAGLGNGGGGLDVLTFDTNALCCASVMACGGFWVPFPSPLSGTLTGVDVAVA
jgi:hypothetical protein